MTGARRLKQMITTIFVRMKTRGVAAAVQTISGENPSVADESFVRSKSFAPGHSSFVICVLLPWP